MPRVSTVIPIYNGVQTLKRAIDSVLSQTFDDFEVIIVDDGSTDSPEKLIAPYLSQHGDKIKYYRKDNEGPGKALEFGINRTQGEYIAFLDQDDYWFPNKLERQIHEFEARPELALVSTDYCEGKEVLDNKDSVLQRSKHFDKGQFEQLLWENPICAPSVLVRKPAVFSVGFSPRCVSYGPWDRPLWVKIAYRYPIKILKEVLVWKYFSESTLSLRKDYSRLQYLCWNHLLDYFCDKSFPVRYKIIIKRNCADKLYLTAMYYFYKDEFKQFKENLRTALRYSVSLLLRKSHFYLLLVPCFLLGPLKAMKRKLNLQLY